MGEMIEIDEEGAVTLIQHFVTAKLG